MMTHRGACRQSRPCHCSRPRRDLDAVFADDASGTPEQTAARVMAALDLRGRSGPLSLAGTTAIDRRIVVHDGAPCSAVKIVILTGLERPQEGTEPEETERQRQRYEIDQHFHGAYSSRLCVARSAFNVTRMDDPDMASAAMRGLAKPRIAIGTAMTL